MSVPTAQNIAFFISTYISKAEHLECLINCIKSIRNIYSNEDIYIFNDSYDQTNAIDIIINRTLKYNAHIHNTKKKGTANIYLFNFIKILDKKYDYYINIHDSTTLTKKLPELSANVHMPWIFREHYQWHKLNVQKYNPADSSIVYHKDEIFKLISKFDPSDFKEKFSSLYASKNKYFGCFGSMFICTQLFLLSVNMSTHIDKLVETHEMTRRDRMSCETIVGIIVYYLYGQITQNITFQKQWGTEPYNEKTKSWNYEYFSKFSFLR